MSDPKSGVTQYIRTKLKFNDEAQWKKFSARRLELIDSHDLSSKKASEQDEQISMIADALRQEFDYPQDTLGDFDKLVRVGVQSVRRNRKRVPKKKQAESPGVILSDSETIPSKRLRSTSPEDRNDRLSINSLITPDEKLPPVHTLSINDTLGVALDRLGSLVLRQGSDGYSATSGANSNATFLGQSIIQTSAAFAVERVFPDTATSANPTVVTLARNCLLSNGVLATLGDAIGAPTLIVFKLVLATNCRSLGFDATIDLLSNAFYELLVADGPENVSIGSLCRRIKQHSGGSRDSRATSILSESPDHNGAAASNMPLIRPVTLRFLSQQFEFTYAANTSTPPTVSEIIDNGKTAFHIIGDNKVIQIRNVNQGGRILDTDADLAETFTQSPRIDLELVIPFLPDGHPANTNTNNPANTNPVPNHTNRLPPLSDITKPRFQQLL
uniref:ARAD1A08206p n=1 Tax=Blastobotrys adeninivorans TaxID=409370 RepID=A0A060SXY3_BLAAD